MLGIETTQLVLGKYLGRSKHGFHNFDPTDLEILQLEQHKKMSGNVGEEATSRPKNSKKSTTFF